MQRSALASMVEDRRPRERRPPQGAGSSRPRALVREWYEKYQPAAAHRTPCRSGRSGSAASSRAICPRTRSSSSIPATPACGWAACTICGHRRRATSAAPAISAGRSRPGSARSARRPTGRSWCSPATAGFWYHIAEIETAVRWKINTVTVVNNNSGGNQSKRGFDRAYGGEQTEQGARTVDLHTGELRPHRRGDGRARHPRRASQRISRRRLQRALSADRPVVIDVVTDIDALAPLAVT